MPRKARGNYCDRGKPATVPTEQPADAVHASLQIRREGNAHTRLSRHPGLIAAPAAAAAAAGAAPAAVAVPAAPAAAAASAAAAAAAAPAPASAPASAPAQSNDNLQTSGEEQLGTAQSPRQPPDQISAQPALLMRPLLHTSAPEWWQVPGEVARAARSFDSTHQALARSAEAAFQSTVKSTSTKRASHFYRAVNRCARCDDFC